MKVSIFVLTVIAMLTLWSCSGGKQQENVASYSWDCSQVEMADSFDVATYMPHRLLLPLEETAESRIAHVDKLILSDSVIIAHEAGSLVYVYDTNQELKSIYGRAASGIQQDYTKCNNIDDFRDNYMQERSSKGRYTSLEFVDETNLLFRTYQLSDKAENDRMQIYKEGVLIGNTNIPKGMHVIGYISPYYYSQIMSDEDEQSLKIYRFKINPDLFLFSSASTFDHKVKGTIKRAKYQIYLSI